ncbi:restriction endonuclease subunit S [Caecibacteroides pullorum]|uniref:restriction endonuclease subunit S n=1 Tax=Caecibacteroides pullorum TaxID=2725562 RepID=UPI001FE4B1C0|nr:restriction endonuclease subunit S [Caecibacteroides pullorum]
MEEYNRIKIQHICSNICSGGTPKSTVTEYYGGNIPWLNTKEINFNQIYKTEKTITNEGLNNSSAKWIPAKSVIVAMYGATAGKAAINRIPLTTNQACCNLMINPTKADYRFVYYALCNDYTYLASLANGGAQQNLNAQQIKDFAIPLPSLEGQKRIANILSSLDDKIELNRRINENLEQQAQALFKSWFVDFEPFKDGKFVDSELGMIPEELTISRIGDIPHTIESGRRPKGGAVLKGIPSIGAENIKGLGYYDYSKTKYIPEDFALTTNRGKVYGYELLIYKDGGKPGYFIPNYTIFGEGFPFDEMYINEHVFRLDFMSKEYNVFAYFYMQTPYIMNQLNSIGGKAAIPGINTKDVESLPIFNGDNKKIQEFGNLVLPMITTILRNCRENARLAQLRDTLLPRLMSGKLKFSETTI